MVRSAGTGGHPVLRGVHPEYLEAIPAQFCVPLEKLSMLLGYPKLEGIDSLRLGLSYRDGPLQSWHELSAVRSVLKH